MCDKATENGNLSRLQKEGNQMKFLHFYPKKRDKLCPVRDFFPCRDSWWKKNKSGENGTGGSSSVCWASYCRECRDLIPISGLVPNEMSMRVHFYDNLILSAQKFTAAIIKLLEICYICCIESRLSFIHEELFSLADHCWVVGFLETFRLYECKSPNRSRKS